MPYGTYSRSTPQSQPLPGQTKNNAGGHSYAVDIWTQLNRFLVLGSEGGTYYVNQQNLTRQNAKAVDQCLDSDAQRAINIIVDVSESGRAAKVNPAIFALALACSHPDKDVRTLAYRNVNRVCRTGTHLFTFLNFVTNLRGSKTGMGFRKAIARWYDEKEVGAVAYQAIKYRQREGWTHRDALRLGHPASKGSEDRHELYEFMSGRPNEEAIVSHDSLNQVDGYLKAQKATSAKEVATLIKEYRLPWEAIPTNFHNEKVVWEAIFDVGALGLTAAIRQLPRLTNLGVIDSRPIAKLITDGEALQKARVHPFTILNALAVYKNPGYSRGNNTWNPARKIIDALDKAFYEAFGNVEPTGKRINIGLDVSGSMGVPIMNSPLSCREGAAAMSLVTASVEDDYEICGFTGDFVHLDISPRQRLDDVVRTTRGLRFGRTDCSLPMRWALANKRKFDAFVIYTDNETWYGNEHPVESLNKYRNKTGINAKLIVVSMCANRFSIADPSDDGMLDVVGFDTAAPNLISEFIKGNV